MNGWMDGWMNEWMDGLMDGWMDGQMDGWMDRWMDRWMDEWMDGWMYTDLRVFFVWNPQWNKNDVTTTYIAYLSFQIYPELIDR